MLYLYVLLSKFSPVILVTASADVSIQTNNIFTVFE